MLAYLIDNFAIFNYLNTSMEEKNVLLFATADKIDSVKRKQKGRSFTFQEIVTTCFDTNHQLSKMQDKF